MKKCWMLLILLTLVACKPSTNATFHATDISGADFAATLNLTDHTGKPRSLADFHGKVIAVFFGYSHCPDVCPTTMTDLKNAMKILGSDAENVQVLFVTLDPERDTQQALASFVTAFDQRFIGLYGSQSEIATVTQTFKIFAAKVENSGRSGYTIDHSAGLYLYDRQGKLRLYADYGTKPEALAADMKQLM